MSRLALVLDSTDVEHVRSIVNSVRGKDLVLKVGLRTLPLFSTDEWQSIAAGVDLFVDAKLHDIPDQVGDAVGLWSEVGAKYLTVHCQGGEAMLKAAAERAGKTRILGVTVLTSLGGEDLQKMGISASLESYVQNLVQVSLGAGVNSFVSSVFEVPHIRKVAKSVETFHVCPGISLDGRAGGDQKRVASLSQALAEGVDLLVMGRSLTQAENFMDTLDKVLETIGRESRLQKS